MWKIFYNNFSFSNADGLPKSAPSRGVLAIAELRDGKSLLHVKGEFYSWDGLGWQTSYTLPNIKFGLLVEDDVYEKAKEEALLWLRKSV